MSSSPEKAAEIIKYLNEAAQTIIALSLHPENVPNYFEEILIKLEELRVSTMGELSDAVKQEGLKEKMGDPFNHIIQLALNVWEARSSSSNIPKNIALVDENEIHVVINDAIANGEAVAFDTTQDRDYYFPPRTNAAADHSAGELGIDEQVARLTLKIHGYTSEAKDMLKARLLDPKFQQRLSNGFMTVKIAASKSPQHEQLLPLRYMFIFSDHPALTAADIVEHAGAQERQIWTDKTATVYLPLSLPEFVNKDFPRFLPHLTAILEHARFHLAGCPGGVMKHGHPYTSENEYLLTETLNDLYSDYQCRLLKQSLSGATHKQAFRRIAALVRTGLIDTVSIENREYTAEKGNLKIIEASLNSFEQFPRNANKTIRYSIWMTRETVGGTTRNIARIIPAIIEESQTVAQPDKLSRSHPAAAAVTTKEFIGERLIQGLNTPMEFVPQKLTEMRSNLEAMDKYAWEHIATYTSEHREMFFSAIGLLKQAEARGRLLLKDIFPLQPRVFKYLKDIEKLTLTIGDNILLDRISDVKLLFADIQESIGLVFRATYVDPEKREERTYRVVGIAHANGRVYVLQPHQGKTQSQSLIFKEVDGTRVEKAPLEGTSAYLLDMGYHFLGVEESLLTREITAGTITIVPPINEIDQGAAAPIQPAGLVSQMRENPIAQAI